MLDLGLVLPEDNGSFREKIDEAAGGQISQRVRIKFVKGEGVGQEFKDDFRGHGMDIFIRRRAHGCLILGFFP